MLTKGKCILHIEFDEPGVDEVIKVEIVKYLKCE